MTHEDTNDPEALGSRGFIDKVILAQSRKQHGALQDIDYYGLSIMNKLVMDRLVKLGVTRRWIHLDDCGG